MQIYAVWTRSILGLTIGLASIDREAAYAQPSPVASPFAAALSSGVAATPIAANSTAPSYAAAPGNIPDPLGGYVQRAAAWQPMPAQPPAEAELPPVTVRPNQTYDEVLESSPTAAEMNSQPMPYQGNSPNTFRTENPFDNGYSIPWSANGALEDQTLVGSYRQPVWTTQRPFAASRVYVLPAGTAQLEQWVRPTWPQAGKPVFRMLEEVAIGLPGRFQLDIYERWNIEPNDQNRNEANHEGIQVELRWALAKWGRLFLNPTLYAEWVERGGPQNKANKYELKLLLAEQFGRNLYYSSNLILEQETQQEKETELGWSHAVSTTVIDRKLMAGMECLVSRTTANPDRSTADVLFTVGPSMQYRPTTRTFLNIVSLFGTTPDSPLCQAYFIFGYQFGLRAGPVRGYVGGPASTIGN